MSDDWEPIVRQLPNTSTTPDIVLGRTLSKREHIESVMVVIMWKDGTHDFDWSRMTLKDLVYLESALRRKVDDIVRGDPPDAIYRPPGDSPA